MYIFHISGEAVILGRRCLYHHFSMVENCTNDKRLIQKYLSTSFASTGPTSFKVDTARGNLCVCRTDICNNAPLGSSKKTVSNKNNNPTISDIAEKDISVIDDGTDYIMSPTSSSLDFVSVNDVTDYWMNYTGSQDTSPQNTQVTERNGETGVSTVDNPTTQGLAAEQVKYNELLLMITITIISLTGLVIN